MTDPEVRTDFERRVERRIVAATERLLDDLDSIGMDVGATTMEIRAACEKFSGPDLAECWDEYVG